MMDWRKSMAPFVGTFIGALYTDSARTQDLTITEQLEHGVRVFDD